MNSEHNNCTALNFTKTTVWSCSCFNGQWIGPIVEIYLKYLLCLWISRSNFVNASQEKFSPVSKVLHRIQNKFPDSQSATVCQIFFLHLYLAFYYWRTRTDGQCWTQWRRNSISVLLCFAGFWAFESSIFRFASFGGESVSSVLPPFLKWFSFDLRSLAALPPSL